MSDSPASPPLPNDPAARTPDGTLKDASTPTTQPPTSGTEPKSNDQSAASPDPAKPTLGPPDAYTFTPPAGQTYDKATIDAATPMFRELGLTQPQADRLVEFWNKQAQSQADIGQRAIEAQGQKWDSQLKADPELGPHLATIKSDMGQAFNALVAKNKLTQQQVDGFKFAMDLSMVGSNPDFVRVFRAFAQPHIEGTSVTGTGPSPNGQNAKGTTPKPSLASAMYPNLTN